MPPPSSSPRRCPHRVPVPRVEPTVLPTAALPTSLNSAQPSTIPLHQDGSSEHTEQSIRPFQPLPSLLSLSSGHANARLGALHSLSLFPNKLSLSLSLSFSLSLGPREMSRPGCPCPRGLGPEVQVSGPRVQVWGSGMGKNGLRITSAPCLSMYFKCCSLLRNYNGR